MRLFIIGNGFDLHHDLKTSFADYRRFLTEKHPKTLESIQNSRYFEGCALDVFNEQDPFWTNVEQNLKFNYDLMLEETVDGYYPPDLLEKSDARWHRAEFDAEEKVKKFDFSFTKKALVQWILSIDILTFNQTKKFSFEVDDYFITFNYTETLEKIYGIFFSHIFHIHGCISNSNSLQFGNPDQIPEKILKKFEKDYGGMEFHEATIKPAEEKYLIIAKAMSKDLNANIPELQRFLRNKKFEAVSIMGHSFMGVDSPYYEKVLIPMYSEINWNIFAHSSTDIKNANAFFAKHRIKGTIIRW